MVDTRGCKTDASYIDEPVVRDGSEGLRYYHRNGQYSITALTNGSGTITERYSYTAYGQPVFFDASGTVISSSAENNRYTYTGREWDSELVLYHYRARMYDGVAGRFLNRDPIEYAGGTYSLYALLASRPTSGIDPLGNEPGPLGSLKPVAGNNCARKFAHMAPDLDVENLADKLQRFQECMRSNPFPASPGGLREYLKKVKQCMKDAAIGDVSDKGKEAIDALSHMYCCEAFKSKAGAGDPCNYGTPGNRPPGDPPRMPIWEPGGNTPRPKHTCGECCEFRACTNGMSKLLQGQGWFKQLLDALRGNGGVAELQACLCECTK